MSKMKRNKCTKPSSSQKLCLLKIIEKNHQLNDGTFTTEKKREEYQNLWERVALKLNSMDGSKKSWEKWRQSTSRLSTTNIGLGSSTNRAKIDFIKEHIGSFSDFPKPGIEFKDIFSALQDGDVCCLLKDLILDHINNSCPNIGAVVGLDARGFLFSFMIASELGIPCIPIRKKGKLPGECYSVEYTLEYGTCWRDIKKDVRRKHEGNPSFQLAEFEERVKKFIREVKPTKLLFEEHSIKIEKVKGLIDDDDILKLEASMLTNDAFKKHRKGQNISKIQKEMLIDFLKDKKNLRVGSYDSTFTKLDAQTLWEYVATNLNAVKDGTQKEWFQWRKTWHDIRQDVKNKCKANKDLSYLENLVLNLIENIPIEEENFELPSQYKIPNVTIDELRVNPRLFSKSDVDNNIQNSQGDENKTLRRTINVSKTQKTMLIKFLKKYPKLARSEFDKYFVKRDAKKLWQLITNKLNSVDKGAEKTFEQWRKCWNDIKKEVKKKSELRKPLNEYELIVAKLSKFHKTQADSSINQNNIGDCDEFLSNKIEAQNDSLNIEDISLDFDDPDDLDDDDEDDDKLISASKCAILYFYEENKTFYIKCKKCTEIFTNFYKFSSHFLEIHIENKFNTRIEPLNENSNLNEIKLEINELDGKNEETILMDLEINNETGDYEVRYITAEDNCYIQDEDNLSDDFDRLENSLKSDSMAQIKKIDNGVTYAEVVVQCKICDRHSVSNRQRYTHEKIYHSDQLIFCQVNTCFETYINQNEYDLHFSTNHTNNPKYPYKCPHCTEIQPRLFPNKDQYTRHVQRIHFKEKNYECRHCGKQFFDRKETYEHEQLHTGQHQICDYCGYSTIYKHNLLSHIRTKHQPHEFLCEICNKSFALRSNLTKHQKSVHSTEKPYKCSFCTSAFGCKDYLRKHIYKKHDVDYRCGRCGQSFNRKSKLNEHTDGGMCMEFLQ